MSFTPFPTLSVPPSTTSNLQKNYRSLMASFGGNYVQQAPDGINSIVPTWNIEYDNLNAADSALLEAFFDSVGAFDFFSWTPPSGNGSVWRIDPSVNSYGFQKTTTGLVNSYSVSFTMVY